MMESDDERNESLPRWRRQGPPYAMTTDELRKELKAHGFEVSENQLRKWKEWGLLPASVKEKPDPMAKRAHALYPWWSIYVINKIVRGLEEGQSSEELRETAEQRIAEARIFASREEQQDVPPWVVLERLGRHSPAVPLALQRAAWAYARRIAAAESTGNVKKVELLIGLRVQTETYVHPIEIPSPPEKRPHRRHPEA